MSTNNLLRERILYKKIGWPDDWKIAACMPDYELATQISRSVLPEKVNMEDAIFNLKRSAMFVDALHTQDSELMRFALRDKLHHPYRSRLIPGFMEIKQDIAEMPDVIGTVISGAGPSIIVIYENNNFDEINKRINSVWEDLGVKVTVKKLNIDTKGAIILS